MGDEPRLTSALGRVAVPHLLGLTSGFSGAHPLVCSGGESLLGGHPGVPSGLGAAGDFPYHGPGVPLRGERSFRTGHASPFYLFVSKEAQPLLDGVLVFGSWSGRGKSSLPGCLGERRAPDLESSSLNYLAIFSG